MEKIDCRPGCGACCIAPSISSPLPSMPAGKPARVACPHLTRDYLCALFNDPRRPQVCLDFQATWDTCGTNREQALIFLGYLETSTTPASLP